MNSSSQAPILDQIYLNFLRDQNSAEFVHSVAQTYTLVTLARLSAYGSRVTRRGAMLALSMLGDYSVSRAWLGGRGSGGAIDRG